jgi:TonB family protein
VFSELKLGGGKRRTWALIASGVLHLGYVLFLVVTRPAPIYVRPQLLAFGDGAKSHGPIYLALDRPATLPRTPSSVRLPKLAEINTVRAGSQRGTLMEGPIYGRDVRPGYPIHFPDPPIDRSKLPPEVQGDVIVEVTIDEQGKVIATRLLQGVGYGVDELVMAAVKQWRYKPATMDGTPIASKHDVHYHFPS